MDKKEKDDLDEVQVKLQSFINENFDLKKMGFIISVAIPLEDGTVAAVSFKSVRVNLAVQVLESHLTTLRREQDVLSQSERKHSDGCRAFSRSRQNRTDVN